MPPTPIHPVPARIPAAPEPRLPDAASRPRRLPILGRRRRLLVNPSFQLRVVAMPVLLSSAAVGFLLGLLLRVTAGGTALPMVPEAGEAVGLGWAWAATGALAFGGLLVLLGLMETHRAAGAIFKVQRHLVRVSDGRLDTRVHLRQKDHFQEFAAEFNEMVASLRESARRNLIEVNEALDSLGPVRPTGTDPISLRMAAAWDAMVAMKHRIEASLESREG